MNSDSTKQIIDALRPIADKVGQGASHLYNIYTRQAYSNGVANLVWAGFLTIALVAAYKYIRFAWGVYQEDKQNNDAYLGGVISTVVVSVIAFFILGAVLTNGLQQLVNPEYYAIRNIICDAKGGCQQ